MNAPGVEHLAEGVVDFYPADNLAALRTLESNSVDGCATDPPYGLGREPDPLVMLRAWLEGGHYDVPSKSGFMGKEWDAFVPQPAIWKEVYRVLKPGAHVLCFFGTRTYDLGVLAIRLAGFEIRNSVQWLYGSGFPKSLDVSKAIDKAAGVEREKVRVDASLLNNPPNLVGGAVKGDDRPWRLAAIERGYHDKDGPIPATAAAAAWDGFGTALKPACEPIILARKPLSESTVAANVLKWGTGALNIDGCRVVADVSEMEGRSGKSTANKVWGEGIGHDEMWSPNKQGRWPANVIHDGSAEVIEAFPDAPGQQRFVGPEHGLRPSRGIYGDFGARPPNEPRGDEGSAARFFYTAKADADDRLGSKHPTVKPLDLMQYLVRLVTPPKGLVLDPFAGTGTTGEACIREGMRAVLIEREEEYQNDIRRRMSLAMSGTDTRKRAAAAERNKDKPVDHGPLFGGGGNTPPADRADRYTATSQIRTNDWPDGTQVVTSK
jgi:site-specific DNA-methyltransferase (adenine-specific)